MASEKREVTKAITVTVDGKQYGGTVVIRGTRFREFIVHFQGCTKSDGRKWGLDDEESKNMMVMAEANLIQLIAERQN